MNSFRRHYFTAGVRALAQLLTALLVLAAPAQAGPILTPSTTTYGGIVNATNFVTGQSTSGFSGNGWPSVQGPTKAVDGVIGPGSKYLNFNITNTALLFANSPARVADRLELWVAEDAVERDPTSYILYGTNAAIPALTSAQTFALSNFTRISSGALALPDTRDNFADALGFSQSIPIPNTTAYASYLLVFPTVKNAPTPANSMQISEVQLYDSVIIGVDQFDYPDGPIADKNGGTFWNWKNQILSGSPAGRTTTGPSDWNNFTNAPAIASGRLITQNSSAFREYNGPTEGLPISTDEGLGAISAFNNGTLSFQEHIVYYRVTVTTGATLPDSLTLTSSDFGTDSVVFGKLTGGPNFAVSDLRSGSATTTSSTALAASTTYTLVARLDFGNGTTGTASLFLNPDLNAPEPAVPLVTQSFNATFWSSRLKLASTGPAAVTWDDLVIATSWDSLGTVVTTLADEDDLTLGGGAGISLREAVKYSPAGTLVTFAPGLSGQTCTLTHADGDMPIPGALTIDASALPAGFTVDGNNASRHFHVAAGKSLTLRGLTFTRGSAVPGGAISSSGALEARDCSFRDNTSSGFGGGIFLNSGTAALSSCTFSANTASSAGAIWMEGTTTANLSHCTVTGNRSTDEFSAGGMVAITGTLTLHHCTVSQNTGNGAGGGLYLQAPATVNVQSSIIAGNADSSARPDIYLFSGTLNATGTSVIGNNTGVTTQFPAGPLVGTGAAPLNPKLSPLGYFGGPVQTMHPLIGSPVIDAAGTTNPGGTDARGFPRFVDGDANSSAQLDIGAVEAGPLTTVVVNTDAGGSTALRSRIAAAAGIPGARIGFLASSFPGTITLNGTELAIPSTPGLFIDASNITGAGITISANNLSRVFNIPATATVAMHSVKIVSGKVASGSNGGGISNAGTCTVIASTLSGNVAGYDEFSAESSYGGGIYNTGTCTVMFSTLSGNNAEVSGGGIRNDSGGTCTVDSATISGNEAGSGGGGISNSGTCTVRSSTITENSAQTAPGGGIDHGGNASARLTVTRSIVAGNTGSHIDNITPNLVSSIGNLFDVDPLLAPLGDYGGPTQTMPPLRGSPAIDAAAATTAQTDQRGAARTRDGDGNGTALPDIGAVEASLVFVTTTGDTGPGTLRAALAEAAAQPGADTVYFTSAVTTPVTLANEIVITDPAGVTVDASDRPTGVVIDGGPGTNRHFRIDTGTTATFQRLRLYGGGGVGSGTPLNYGGSIYNSGALTLRECTFADNSSTSSAGAVYNQSGALTVERSTFHGNTSGGSGAILHESQTPMIITASTFTGNVGRFEGGAITLGGFRPATITHCTIVGNAVTQTGGGGSGGVRAGNPGNAASNLLTLRDSIVAENTDANLPGVPNVNAGFINPAGSVNLTTGDAKLAALGDYGGPAWTMPPMPGSVAIDGALASTAQTDQRGATRLVDGNLDMNDFSDMGAVEVPAPLTVSTTADQNDTPAGATVSLREAIRDAAAGATILFASSFNGEPGDTITLSQSLGEITFTKGLIINASANPGGVTIDGGPGTNRIFYLPPSTGAFLQRLTLTGGNGRGAVDITRGGAILSHGATLALADCTLTGNTAAFSGGAIRNSHGNLTLDRCLFTGNSTQDTGGAISSLTALLTGPATTSVTVSNCTVTNNTSPSFGGGIYNVEGRFTLLHCTITGNTAPAGSGSGVASFGDNLNRTTVQNCLIAGNANASDVSFVGQAPLTNTFLSLGGNLIGSGNATGAFNQLRDGIGATAATVRLALLSDFGGPTETIALRPGSPALGNAVANVNLIPITNDQRGFPAVGLKDSGAYEAGNNLLTSYNSWIWETLSHTASENDAVSSADFDRDGQTNEAEWLAQTNPGNPGSVFRPTGFISGQFFVVEFPTITGRRYTLQFSDDLQPGGWFDSVGLTGNNNVQSFSVPRLQPRRFFRVKISR